MKILVEWNLWDNPKVARLATCLGRGTVEVVGYLVRLWGWAAEYRPDGDLSALSSIELAQACHWRGSPFKFRSSLQKAGWLDQMQIHEWQAHQGKFIEKIHAERARKKRDYEARRLHGDSEETPSENATPVSVSVSVPLPSPEPSPAPYPKDEEKSGADAPGSPVDRIGPLLAALLDLWNHGKPDRAWIRATPARAAKIKARLADGFTEDQLRLAITNIKQSEWHNGVNDRGWRAPGPEWVFHTRERTESWINWTKPTGGANGKSAQGHVKTIGKYSLPPGSFQARSETS